MSAGVGSALRQAAHRFELNLTDDAVSKFGTYIAILLHWRTRISLTTASTADEIIKQQIADSFALIPHLPVSCNLADIGSGAGFPGVPIAIVRPDARVLLIEARRKRASFLREVVRQAALSNTEVAETRVELLPEEFGESFDIVTSKAFGSVVDFLTLSAPLLRRGGVAIAMKGPKGRSEALPHTGFAEPESITYSLGDFGDRLLLKYTRT